MSGGARFGVGALAAVVVIACLVWFNLTSILLFGIHVLMERRLAVGAHQEAEWATGVDPEGRSPAERPPNIVLILADDLGWNDLTFRGGGVARGTVPTPRSTPSPQRASPS